MPQDKHPHQAQQMRVTGTVNKVRFRADSGFTILNAALTNDEGQDDDATVIGVMPPLEVGDTFKAEVSLEQHPEYGYQYKVLNMMLEAVPSDLSDEGIAAYLEARVGGVGKVLAGRMVQHFGADTFDVLSEDPEKLLQVPGITQAPSLR